MLKKRRLQDKYWTIKRNLLKRRYKENTERLSKILIQKKEENAKQPSKVIKAAKAPIGSKDMSVEGFDKKTKWGNVKKYGLW